MTDAHEGTRGNEATMWDDEAMHAAYKEAFDKDPDAHHWALLSWIRDDMQQALAAQAARIEQLEQELAHLRKTGCYPMSQMASGQVTTEWNNPEDDEAWKNL